MRAILLLLAPVVVFAQLQTKLAPETERAFDEYVKAAEAKMDWRTTRRAKAGDLLIEAWGGHSPTGVKSGMVHDWVASTIAPGLTADKVIAVLQDYPNYKNVYSPEVIDSKLLGREGDRWRAFLKLKKTKGITAILNSEYEVEYRRLEGGRWAVISRSTKMTEVDVDKGTEKELPAGTGHGFLWRLNAYWMLEPRAEGLYMECRSISLSRDVPAVLRWIIKPIVSGLPRESLKTTLDATRRAAQ